jgi:TatD DNase family protein
MQLTDIHTHTLNHRDKETRVINLFPGEVPKNSEGNLFSMGLHPWHSEKETADSEIKIIEKALKKNKLAAVGEAGLDRACGTPFEFQKEVFIRQAELARKYEKPMIIHCVRAYYDIISLHEALKPEIPWIIHGYNKGPGPAGELLKHKIMLSFGVALIKKENIKLFEALRKTPHDALFLETDNNRHNIYVLFEKAASIRGISIEELAAQVKNNFIRVFGDDIGKNT